jgi:hypothetical protein
MSTISAELEQEFAHELGGGAAELEGPHTQEAEAFFNSLAAMGDRRGRSQSLRRIALAAARSAMRGAATRAPVIVGEMELEAAAELEQEIARAVVRGAPKECLPEMEHMGHAAAEAETEQEAAEHFLPLIPLAAKALVPLAMKAAPAVLKAGGALLKKAVPKVMSKVVPRLTRGIGNLARTLHRSPATRNLLRTVPKIARGTVASLAKRVARGQPVTARIAGRTLARQTARVLSHPRQAVAAYRRSRMYDRRHHLRARRRVGPPQRGYAAHAMGAPVPMVSAPPPAYAIPGAYPAAPVTAYAVPVPAVAPAVAAHTCPTCGR